MATIEPSDRAWLRQYLQQAQVSATEALAALTEDDLDATVGHVSEAHHAIRQASGRLDNAVDWG